MNTGGCNSNRGSASSNPGMHQGNQSGGAVIVRSNYSCSVDNLFRESTTTAEFIVLDVSNSETAGRANVYEFRSKSTTNTDKVVFVLSSEILSMNEKKGIK